jgi:hypothetical protein
MSALFIALIFSVGASTWIYNKLRSRTGYGNNAAAFKGAAIAFVLLFVVVFSLCLMLLPKN